MWASRGPIAALSSHTLVTGVGITLLGLAVLALLTPRIAFNDGLGNDGSAYASVTEALRGNPADPQWAAFAYRLLPSAIVALMPVDVVTGFLIVNILAILASAILLLRLLDRYGVRSPVALLALVWWMTLPMGPRWHIYYPVLGDAYGFFILLALILCALERGSSSSRQRSSQACSPARTWRWRSRSVARPCPHRAVALESSRRDRKHSGCRGAGPSPRISAGRTDR